MGLLISFGVVWSALLSCSHGLEKEEHFHHKDIQTWRSLKWILGLNNKFGYIDRS